MYSTSKEKGWFSPKVTLGKMNMTGKRFSVIVQQFLHPFHAFFNALEK